MPRNGSVDATGSGDTAAAGAIGGISGYPDELIATKGVPFNVRYTGCIEVKTSMKLLDFGTRTQVARECINRVCEAAGLKSIGKRNIDKKIHQYISERPCMQNAGANVIINISSRAFTLVNVETGEIIATHSMPRISFASGGDSDTIDFLAYIAKNEDDWRGCFVLECIGGQSEELIVTIGKAFMLRFNALSRQNDPAAVNFNKTANKEHTKDYYNDLPNKLPPDLLTDEDLLTQTLTQTQSNGHGGTAVGQKSRAAAGQQQQQLSQVKLTQAHQEEEQQEQARVITQLNLKKPRDRLSSNLIDLNSPPPDRTTTSRGNLSSFDPMLEHSAANSVMKAPPVRDVFDIPPLCLTPEVQRAQLLVEPWFHGVISRPTAECLLKRDGDFLVRESQGKPGQYVLSGLEGKTPKHLLLIDPEGVVRTKDRVFESITHLIEYHYTNCLPIISEDSELVLRNPVHRQHVPAMPAAAAAATVNTAGSA